VELGGGSTVADDVGSGVTVGGRAVAVALAPTVAVGEVSVLVGLAPLVAVAVGESSVAVGVSLDAGGGHAVSASTFGSPGEMHLRERSTLLTPESVPSGKRETPT
jgi:hypothetical protein